VPFSRRVSSSSHYCRYFRHFLFALLLIEEESEAITSIFDRVVVVSNRRAVMGQDKIRDRVCVPEIRENRKNKPVRSKREWPSFYFCAILINPSDLSRARHEATHIFHSRFFFPLAGLANHHFTDPGFPITMITLQPIRNFQANRICGCLFEKATSTHLTF